MNSTEEQLWNYIDGTCTPEEAQAIAVLIKTNPEYKSQYAALLALNLEFSNLELEEPPMAFTYRVMEAVRAEEASVPLKAAINKNVIRGVVGAFVFIITALIVYAMLSINWAVPETAHPENSFMLRSIKLPDFKLPAMKNMISSPVIKAFIFFDVVLGLFFFDAYLRRQRTNKQL